MVEVSVVIPTFNRSQELKRVLDSLLQQSIDSEHFEIIVVDDAGSDDTRSVVEQFKKKKKETLYIKNEKNVGPGVCRNIGAKKASGIILAFIDDDCIASKHWLREILASFREVPSAKLVYGPVESRCPMLRPFVHEFTVEHYAIATANSAIRKDFFKRIGSFDPVMSYWAEDNEIERRIKNAGEKIAYNKRMAVLHPPKYVPYSLKRMLFTKKQFVCTEHFIHKHPKSGFSRGVYAPIVIRFCLRAAFVALVFLLPLGLIEKILITLGSFWLHSLYRTLRTQSKLKRIEWDIRIKMGHALQFIFLNWVADFYNFFALLLFKVLGKKRSQIA